MKLIMSLVMGFLYMIIKEKNISDDQRRSVAKYLLSFELIYVRNFWNIFF